jgi:hypothetical protein
MGVCHCKHCQRQGGSAFSTMAGIPRAELTFKRGSPTVYHAGTDSGDSAEMQFCGQCGSPIFTVLANQPDLLLLKTGTLETTDWFTPQFHVWCDDKQHWVDLDEASGSAHGRGA